MSGLFALLFVLSFIGIFAGFYRPSLIPNNTSRKKAGLTFLGLTFLFLILIGATAPTVPKPTPSAVQTENQSAVKGLTTQEATPGASLAPIATPTPTLIPTPLPTATPVTNSGLSNDNTYINSNGQEVHSPAYSNTVPDGATAICGDGTYSFSRHRRGTCSHHGGVAQWL